MENEIKVNEYVRMIDGLIAKIVTKDKDDHFILDRYYAGGRYLTEIEVKNDIVKHSPELLDLIKAEDTIKIKIGLYTSFVHFIVDEDDLISIRAQIEANFWIIDKIYTKEMMESISYKVKQEEN